MFIHDLHNKGLKGYQSNSYEGYTNAYGRRHHGKGNREHMERYGYGKAKTLDYDASDGKKEDKAGGDKKKSEKKEKKEDDKDEKEEKEAETAEEAPKDGENLQLKSKTLK